MADDTPIGRVEITVKADRRQVEDVHQRAAAKAAAAAQTGDVGKVVAPTGLQQQQRAAGGGGAHVTSRGAGGAAGMSRFGALGPLAIGATAVVASFAALTKITKRLISAHDERVRTLAIVSPIFAGIQARANLNQLHRDIRRADQLAPSALALQPGMTALKDTMNQLGTNVTEFFNGIMKDVLDTLQALHLIAESQDKSLGVNDAFVRDVNAFRGRSEELIDFTPTPATAPTAPTPPPVRPGPRYDWQMPPGMPPMQ